MGWFRSRDYDGKPGGGGGAAYLSHEALENPVLKMKKQYLKKKNFIYRFI